MRAAALPYRTSLEAPPLGSWALDGGSGGASAAAASRGASRVLGVAAACALAVALVLGAAAGDAPPRAGDANAFVGGADVGAGDGLLVVVYVGYDPATFDPALPWSEERVLAGLLAWWSGHVGDAVREVERVEVRGALVGHRVTYLPGGATIEHAWPSVPIPAPGARFDAVDGAA